MRSTDQAELSALQRKAYWAGWEMTAALTNTLNSLVTVMFCNCAWPVIFSTFGNDDASQHLKTSEKRGKQRASTSAPFFLKYMFAVWHKVQGLMSGCNWLIFQTDHFKYMLENALFQNCPLEVKYKANGLYQRNSSHIMTLIHKQLEGKVAP